MKRKLLIVLLSSFLFGITLLSASSEVLASHSWGNYHWARTENPFTLNLGDNLSSNWDSFLNTTSADWSLSSVLDTSVVPGNTSAKRCKPTSGRVEVCNSTYGRNGWLGLAQIWISGNHITQGVTKLNDTYFKTSKYNTIEWKNMVMCQEVGHVFGLDHQDENFNNTNLGTCMDYTDDPSSNQHPNTHDYEELEDIYSHLDSFTSLQFASAKVPFGRTVSAAVLDDLETRSSWGKTVRDNGHVAVFERDLGFGNKVFTFTIWAE